MHREREVLSRDTVYKIGRVCAHFLTESAEKSGASLESSYSQRLSYADDAHMTYFSISYEGIRSDNAQSDISVYINIHLPQERLYIINRCN